VRPAKKIAQRLGEFVFVAAVVVILTTLLIHLAPGDPARVILGVRASPEAVDQLRSQLGLNQGVFTQIVDAFERLLHGDLGTSLINSTESVSSIVGSAIPITASIIGGALLIATVIGVPLGLWAGVSRRRGVSRGISSAALVLLSFPPFALSLVLLLIVAVGMGLAPAGGWGHGWPENLRYAWLPSLALSALVMPQVIRTVRQTASEAAAQDFVEAARSRGLSPTRIALRHILPNSLLPVITVIGLNAAGLIAGAVVVEAVFGLPGLGGVLSSAVNERDYTVIQGVALATAVAVITINLITDLLYALVDPRVRTGGGQ
jgi:peptide/nickel transport system permease protein